MLALSLSLKAQTRTSPPNDANAHTQTHTFQARAQPSDCALDAVLEDDPNRRKDGAGGEQKASVHQLSRPLAFEMESSHSAIKSQNAAISLALASQ